MNKGTTKIKAISRRALEIREKAGFTTETIVKKRYKMAYVPDAIKRAAKELKTPVAPVKSKSYKVVRIVKAGTGRVFFYPINEDEKRLTKTNFARKYDAENLGKWYVEKYIPNKEVSKATKSRTVKTKQLSRRAGQSTKTGVKVVKAGVSDKVTSAVREVLKMKRFDDLDFPSGKLLYSIKKVAGRFTIPEKDIDNPTIKMLLEGYYIETLNFSGKYKVTKSGAEFIKLVYQHIKNAKTDKFNPRLFK